MSLSILITPVPVLHDTQRLCLTSAARHTVDLIIRERDGN